MKKLFMLVSKTEGREYYQLLVGNRCTRFSYMEETEGDYGKFLDEISRRFVKIMERERQSFELQIVDGYRFSSEGLDKVDKLEDTRLLEAKLEGAANKSFRGEALVISGSTN